MTTRTKLIAVFAAIAAVIVACESSTIVDPNSHFATSLSGPKEVPANAATGTGQAVVTLTPSGILSYNVTWTGLTGAYTDAHIHGPADSTGIANVIVDFKLKPAGSTNDTISAPPAAAGFARGTLNTKAATTYGGITGDSLVALLNAGKLYVNIHTVANAGGEIRGQLKKQ